jgi:flagellar hook-associated protein 3 FlgL
MITTTLSPQNQEFVNNLDRIGIELNTDELDISSGVRMQQVSDFPDQVSELLQARAALSASQQISTNLTGVTTEVNTGEQTLESAVQLFDQVQTLAAEGATGTQTAATRATLAQQVQSIEQQFVGFANTNIEGRYIFSGNSDQTAP